MHYPVSQYRYRLRCCKLLVYHMKKKEEEKDGNGSVPVYHSYHT